MSLLGSGKSKIEIFKDTSFLIQLQNKCHFSSGDFLKNKLGEAVIVNMIATMARDSLRSETDLLNYMAAHSIRLTIIWP